MRGEQTPAPTPEVSWLRRDLRCVPAAVWAAVLLHLLLLVVWTTLQPAFRGLDEAAHIDMVVTLPSPADWPAPGAKLIDDRVRATFDDAGHDGLPFARLPRDAAQQPRSDRPSFDEAGGTDKGPAANQMIQHPPTYYALVALGMEVVPGTEQWPYDRQIALMRFLSLLMVFPLPLLCWLAARRLGLSETAAVVAAYVPLVMPSVQRVGSSVSNDALLVLLFGIANVLAIAVAAGDLRRRTAVALGGVSAVAILTKGTALVLPFVILLAYAVAAYRARSVRAVVAPFLVSSLLVAVLSGWWYVRNLVVHGAVQPNGYAGGGLPYPRGQGGGLGEWGPQYVDQMLFRFWSALGEPEPPQLSDDLASGLTIGLLVLVALGVAVASGRRAVVAVGLLPFLGTLALVAVGSYVNFQTYDRMIGVQGRYLYPALVGVAAAVAVLAARLPRRVVAGIPLLLLGIGAGINYLAVRAVLTTYWTPGSAPGALGNGFDALEAWSPLPEGVVRGLWLVTLLVGLATAAAAALLLVQRPKLGAPHDSS